VTKKRYYRDGKAKRPPGAFVALPHIALRSEQWAALPPFAVKLLVDLLAQYDGNNNGDLTAAWTVMRTRRWRSQDSLHKALRELESRGWIQRTRQGGRHVATLWALTMYALDDDNAKVKAKLDIVPSDYCRGAWSQHPIAPPVVPIDGDSCVPPAVSIPAPLHRPSYQLDRPNRPIAPPAVSVEPVSAQSLHRRLYTSKELPSTTATLYPPSPPPGVVVGPEFERARQRAAKRRAHRERAKAKAEQPAPTHGDAELRDRTERERQRQLAAVARLTSAKQ
jgi:hypothetical protein